MEKHIRFGSAQGFCVRPVDVVVYLVMVRAWPGNDMCMGMGQIGQIGHWALGEVVGTQPSQAACLQSSWMVNDTSPIRKKRSYSLRSAAPLFAFKAVRQARQKRGLRAPSVLNATG
jgi:hypothetical protein